MAPSQGAGPCQIMVSFGINRLNEGYIDIYIYMYTMIAMKPVVEISLALADEMRLRIVVLLDGATLSVKCIVGALKVPQPNISRHLSVLRKSHLVQRVRGGVRSYYSLHFNGMSSQLKKKLVVAYQKELKEKEPYKSDKKRLIRIAHVICDYGCKVPGVKISKKE